MVNWEFFDNQTPERAVELVDELRAGDRGHRDPRRRAVCTWREAERVLAGFPDDRADEGPSAGPASLVGLELARDNGWTAPTANGEADGGRHRAIRRGRAGRHLARRVRDRGRRRPPPTPSTTRPDGKEAK